MAISTMYPAKPGSPKTTLAAELSAVATSMTLEDATVLPSPPNLAVIGDDYTAEIVSYTTISGNVVSGLIRGLGDTTASVWSEGTNVARNFTSFDHDRFIENITALGSDKQDALTFDASPTEDSTNPVTSGGVYTSLAGKQDTLTFDSAPTSASTNPVTSGGVYDAFAKEIQYFTTQTVSVASSAQIMRIPSSGTDDTITTDTVVLSCVFAAPANVTSDVTWTSYSGYVTFSGTCTAATTANVILGTKGN